MLPSGRNTREAGPTGPCDAPHGNGGPETRGASPMRSFYIYATSARTAPRLRARNQHADVDLLTYMACAAAVFRYAPHANCLSRHECFRIAWRYVTDELWPLTSCVPDRARACSVFLGRGSYREGSLRRWVGDCQGMVAVESFNNQSVLRRARASSKMAATVRAKADGHLRSIIGTIDGLPSNLERDELLQALNQLHKELFR